MTDVSGLAPIEVESAPVAVAARIRAGIFDHRFPPGTQLNEVELARELAVSRGPLREAFSRLVHEGLLRRERNRGVFVVALDESSIRDVYLARDAIEGAAATRLVTTADPEAFTELDAIVAAMMSASDGEWAELVSLDLSFHQTLVRLAASERLERAFEPLYAETRLCLTYLDAHYSDRRAVHDEHRGIVAAIRSGDAESVRELIHQHMTESARALTTTTEGTLG